MLMMPSVMQITHSLLPHGFIWLDGGGWGGRNRPNDFWMKSVFCTGIRIHFPGTISSFHAAATKSNTERGPVKALQMLVQIALEIQFQ